MTFFAEKSSNKTIKKIMGKAFGASNDTQNGPRSGSTSVPINHLGLFSEKSNR